MYNVVRDSHSDAPSEVYPPVGQALESHVADLDREYLSELLDYLHAQGVSLLDPVVDDHLPRDVVEAQTQVGLQGPLEGLVSLGEEVVEQGEGRARTESLNGDSVDAPAASLVLDVL